MLFQHTMLNQLQGAIQRSLATHGRQQSIGAFAGDNVGNCLPMDWLDIDGIGHVRIGHDRGWVGVDQDHPVALLPQCLAGLRAGIVKFASLADHDGTGANNQDTL